MNKEQQSLVVAQSTLRSVLSSGLDSFHCSEEDEANVGLDDVEVVFDQSGGGIVPVEKILSGHLREV